MHSKLPWGQHPAYLKNHPYKFEYRGKELTAFEITIASGDKLIGEIRMIAGSDAGHPRVDDEQESRDNAAFLFNAVNSHDDLVAKVAKLGRENDDLNAVISQLTDELAEMANK